MSNIRAFCIGVIITCTIINIIILLTRRKEQTMSDYIPKCATCEHFKSCSVQKELKMLYEERFNRSRELAGRTDGFVDGHYVKDIAEQTEPQTEYKKWETKPTADIPTENTTCVGVAMALVEYEPTTEDCSEVADCAWK